jgi:hypothetical protein
LPIKIGEKKNCRGEGFEKRKEGNIWKQRRKKRFEKELESRKELREGKRFKKKHKEE